MKTSWITFIWYNDIGLVFKIRELSEKWANTYTSNKRKGFKVGLMVLLRVSSVEYWTCFEMCNVVLVTIIKRINSIFFQRIFSIRQKKLSNNQMVLEWPKQTNWHFWLQKYNLQWKDNKLLPLQLKQNRNKGENCGCLCYCHCPGHTPGHCAYYCEEDRVLMCGGKLIKIRLFVQLFKISLITWQRTI